MHSNGNEQILTVDQAAQYLGMNKRQIWEMTRARGQARMPVPIPVIRINGNIRFKKSSLERWIDQLEEHGRTAGGESGRTIPQTSHSARHQ